MGALAKNKITRAEQGKRRHGNTPNLNGDYRVVSVPLHKRTLMASLFQAAGIIKESLKK